MLRQAAVEVSALADRGVVFPMRQSPTLNFLNAITNIRIFCRSATSKEAFSIKNLFSKSLCVFALRSVIMTWFIHEPEKERYPS